jgi:outer membrane assembly lipoprotein YfiO
MSYYGDKDYELAAVEFSRLKNSYPQSGYADNAQFMAGVCYFENSPKNPGLDQEDLKRAIVALGDFILDNPDSPLVEDAEMVVDKARTKLAKKEYNNGMVYMKVYDYRAAGVYFQYVIDEFIDTEFAPLALFKLAEIDYKKKDFKSASERFNQFMNIYAEHELMGDARDYLDKISPMLVDTVDVSDGSE